MKKKMSAKQIVALAGVILLAGMYIVSLVLAIIHSPLALTLLKISVVLTILIPIFIYFIMMFYKLSHRKDESEASTDEKIAKK